MKRFFELSNDTFWNGEYDPEYDLEIVSIIVYDS